METKLNLNNETISALEELAQINIDSHNILKEASAAIASGPLAALLRRVANTRTAHAEELNSYLRANAETPQEDGTVRGSVHQMWVKFRGAINGGDSEVVFIEAERAEDVIKAKYEKLLVETAGSAMNDVLMRQFREVKQHHDQIRDLRDALIAA